MGCLKIILVPACFASPLFSLPQQGNWDILRGSLPLLGCPGPSHLPRAPWQRMHGPPILAYPPQIIPAVQAGPLDHTPPHPIPTSLVAGLGFSFWELRSDLNSPLVLTSHSGPEGPSASSSPSKAAPTPRCRETARFSALALPPCQVSALGRASLAGSPAALQVVLGLTSSLPSSSPVQGSSLPLPRQTLLIS